MKRIAATIILAAVLLMLVSCGGKKCDGCGKTVSEGYNVFGKFYCEDCMW